MPQLEIPEAVTTPRRRRARRRSRWVSPYRRFAEAAGHVTRTEPGEFRTCGLVHVERAA